ncbi:MAG: S1C family serine protease, partial [Planctomycetota bacterium]
VRPSVALVTAEWRVDIDKTRYFSEQVVFSAVVYSEDGYLVTVRGGVVKAESIKVDLPGKGKLPAKVVGTDRETGLAVLKVEAAGLVPAKLAWKEQIRQGGFAIAVGNAFGLKGTSSVGFISGVDRTIYIGERHMEDMLQISTPFAPGDSGGFVADARGSLIGIAYSVYQPDKETTTANVLQLMRKGGKSASGPSHTVSFAVPAHVVRFVAGRIIKYGKMRRGFLGVNAGPGSDGKGCVLSRVERGGPAHKAGLRRRDVLVSFNGKPLEDVNDLRWIVARMVEPKKVKVEYVRMGRKRQTEVTVEIKSD